MGEIRRRRRGRLAPRDETEARLEATRAIGWAVKTLKVLQILYWIDAAMMGLVALLAAQVGATTVAYVSAACMLLAVGGAIFVVRQPAAWSLVLAVAHSVPAALAVWVALNGVIGLNSILSILLCILLWCAVSMALKTSRLLLEYPDVWAARRMRGEVRSEDRMGSRYREDAQARARKRNMMLLGIAGGVGVLIAAAVLLNQGDDAPGGGGGPSAPPPKPTIAVEKTAAEYAEAWGVGGMAGISPYIADSKRARIVRGLNKMIRRHKWDREAFPEATNMTIEPYDDWHAYAHYDVKDYGTMRASWEWEKDRWVLVRVRFKRAE